MSNPLTLQTRLTGLELSVLYHEEFVLNKRQRRTVFVTTAARRFVKYSGLSLAI
jgi:hypothetical protein